MVHFSVLAKTCLHSISSRFYILRAYDKLWSISFARVLLACTTFVSFTFALISLETAVWYSALHTTNNMETGLGVAKL